jgi:hypothetical protein
MIEMTTELNRTWDAVWEAKRNRYVTAHGWVSNDGDHWIDSRGEPCESDAFRTATIRLVGGPRDGDVML